MDSQEKNINIQLNYSRSLSVISGRITGIECYQQQMKEIIDANLHTENVKFTIVFPESVKLVSGSYLLGMFEEINNKLGIEGINTLFSFEDTTGDDLKAMLLNELKRSAC